MDSVKIGREVQIKTAASPEIQTYPVELNWEQGKIISKTVCQAPWGEAEWETSEVTQSLSDK